MRTEDNIIVKPGALVWYVNAYGSITPIIFKKVGKTSVKYFAVYKNAQKYVEDNKDVKFYGLRSKFKQLKLNLR